MAKYTLVHFTRNPKVNTQHPLRLSGFTVTPTPSCRYLGLQTDSKLKWRDHIQRIQEKASKRLITLSSLASSTWGANLHTLRLVYQAMILPQMLYGYSAWYTTRMRRTSGKPYMHQSTMARFLTPVQRRAAQVITGAFRTAAANAVEVEAYLLPMDQQMEKISLQSTLRILSTPSYDSIVSTRENTQASQLYYHNRTLQKNYKVNPANLERRHPHIIAPWWEPPTVVIDNTSEEGILQHKNTYVLGDVLCIYTDGSGINGQVGSAAVTLLDPGSPTSPSPQRSTCYMGRETESTMYAAELKGISLALQIVETLPNRQYTRATIFTDNQSALRALHNPGNASGQYVLRELLQLLERVVNLGVMVDLRWIPAHRGIPGNEAADRAAKEAAGYRPDSPLRTPRRNQDWDQGHTATEGVKTLISTAKRSIHRTLQDNWVTIWTHGKHGRHLHCLGARPDKKNLKVHKDLPRAVGSIITQMRTGKIGLRSYLYGINKADSSQCTCNQGEQTVEHVLLKCREWIAERQELWAGSRPILNLRGLLNDPRMAVRAARMMLKTGLLEQFKHSGPVLSTDSMDTRG